MLVELRGVLSRISLFETPVLQPTCSSVHGIFQVRILEWVAISFSKGSSQPRIKPESLALRWVSCVAGRFFTN